MQTVSLGHERATDVHESGGKGASLARLAAIGLPVPPGFIVCGGALERSLGERTAELCETVAGANKDSRLADCAARAQAIVAAATVAPDLEREVHERYSQLGDNVPVAVRSSAVAEDSEAASYAGQHDTFLNVRGSEQVIARIRDCWASYFSERALFYRARMGSLDDMGIAVVVQRLVNADVAGVMFTADPVSGRKDRIVIEAVLGLGEAVASGEVTPDHYVVKRDGSVVREAIARQPVMVRALPEGGIERVELSPGEGSRRKLDDQTLASLTEIGCRLEQHPGAPQDVEWALSAGRLYILQSRPLTA